MFSVMRSKLYLQKQGGLQSPLVVECCPLTLGTETQLLWPSLRWHQLPCLQPGMNGGTLFLNFDSLEETRPVHPKFAFSLTRRCYLPCRVLRAALL